MSVEEYFAEAADRLQGGETIERIITDYPLAVRSELRDLLAVVEFAEQIAAIVPSRPLPKNSFAAHISFAQRAAELRKELEAGQLVLENASIAAPQQPKAPAQPASRQVRVASWWQRLTERWALPAPAPLLRLAPLTLLLAVTYVLTSTLVVTAKEALPGNPVYPMRLWMLEQGVATAPVQQKAEVRWQVDRELAGDVARLAEQLQSTPDAVPVVVDSIQQFRGFDEDQLLIGDLRVVPWHQPAGAGPDEWYPITIEGTLEPGATVALRYQVIPGATDVVQGIELTVLQDPAMPTPSPTPLPPTAPAADAHCQRVQPPNWVAYSVRPGESLRDIAVRAQTTSAELRRVNCLTDGNVRSGTTIFVPVTILGRVPAAPPPAVATAFPTRVAPPTATPVPAPPTNTPSPPTSAPTLTPTSEVASPEPTGVAPDGGGEATSPAPPTETAPSTPAATGTGAETPVTTDTPGATETPVTHTATPDPTAASGQSPTPSATAETGVVPTEERPAPPTATATSLAPTAEASPPPVVSPTERPADTATPLPTAAAEATSTTAPTDGSQAGSANATPTAPPPTATPPPPTATQPPPTAPPPPPTQPPPTATQPPPTATQPPPPTQPPPTATQPPPPTSTPEDSPGADGG